jgi:hypothetical protein
MNFMKVLRIVLLVVGLLLFLISVLADMLGLGISVGFGTRQIFGTILGLIVTAVGVFLLLKKEKK